MRAGTLSDPFVATLVEEGFVCAWEKKGAVECYRVKEAPGQTFKVGGNILTYVCTPRGEVLHAMPGLVRPEAFKEEILWARSIHREMAGLRSHDAVDHLRAAHGKRTSEAGRAAQGLLSSQAFLPIAQIERLFFQALLGQTYAPEKDIIIRVVSQGDLRKLVPRWGG